MPEQYKPPFRVGRYGTNNNPLTVLEDADGFEVPLADAANLLNASTPAEAAVTLKDNNTLLQMGEPVDLAAGFTDFVTRLRYHTQGAGVREHCTANAVFIVQALRRTWGLHDDWAEGFSVVCDDCHWDNMDDFVEYIAEDDNLAEQLANHIDATWGFLFTDEQWGALLSEPSLETFKRLSDDDKWRVIRDFDDFKVVGWKEHWEYVTAHFTKEGAETFIARKKHDYPAGLRVMVDSQYGCHEFNHIITLLVNDKLGLKDQGG